MRMVDTWNVYPHIQLACPKLSVIIQQILSFLLCMTLHVIKGSNQYYFKCKPSFYQPGDNFYLMKHKLGSLMPCRRLQYYSTSHSFFSVTFKHNIVGLAIFTCCQSHNAQGISSSVISVLVPAFRIQKNESSWLTVCYHAF